MLSSSKIFKTIQTTKEYIQLQTMVYLKSKTIWVGPMSFLCLPVFLISKIMNVQYLAELFTSPWNYWYWEIIIMGFRVEIKNKKIKLANVEIEILK